MEYHATETIQSEIIYLFEMNIMWIVIFWCITLQFSDSYFVTSVFIYELSFFTWIQFLTTRMSVGWGKVIVSVC